MNILEAASMIMEKINNADRRLKAHKVVKKDKVTIYCTVGRNTCEITLSPNSAPVIEDGSYSKLLCIKSVRTFIDDMPATVDEIKE